MRGLLVAACVLSLAAAGCGHGTAHPAVAAQIKLPVSLDKGALTVTSSSTSGSLSESAALVDMRSAEPEFYSHLSLSNVVAPSAVYGAITLRPDLTPKGSPAFTSTPG